MVSRRVTGDEKKQTRRRPATTPEQRENQLIALAADLAERQMRDGTASSQIVTHYLKLGSTREKLEQEKLRQDNLLAEARIRQIESGAHIEALYNNAIAAMRNYAGLEPEQGSDLDEG